MYKVALDVMGGDFAPKEILKGAKLALKAFPDLHLTLLGPEAVLKSWKDKERVSLVFCEEVVEMTDTPSEALKNKKKATIFEGLKLLKTGDAQAFVSFFLFFKASEGVSVISTTSSQNTKETLSLSFQVFNTASGPKRIKWSSGNAFNANSAPFNISFGAKSPPIISSATLYIEF